MNYRLLRTFSLLFFFFVINLHAKAQQDSDAPTKEDAVKFIEKIYRLDPYCDSTQVALSDCELIITNFLHDKGEDYNKTIWKINLSGVHFDDKQILKSDYPNSIKCEKWYKKHKNNKEYKFDDENSLPKAEFLISSYISNDERSLKNHYHDRIKKAIEFLMNSCKQKIDSNDKF